MCHYSFGREGHCHAITLFASLVEEHLFPLVTEAAMHIPYRNDIEEYSSLQCVYAFPIHTNSSWEAKATQNANQTKSKTAQGYLRLETLQVTDSANPEIVPRVKNFASG